MPIRFVRAAALLATAAFALAGCGGLPAELREVLPVGGDFTLAGPGGAPFRLADHPDKVKLVFFGFATCPLACPSTLLRLGKAASLLEADDKARLMVVFVSVDPARDTPDAATAYVNSFGLPGVGVTGDDAALAPVVKQYAGFYKRTDDPANPIEHNLNVYLLDTQNRTRRLISSSDSPEQVAAWIAALARQP